MIQKTRVLLVEDHAILRDGLRTILSDYPEFDIIGEAEDGQGALQQCQAHLPDIVLLDLSLPGMDGIEVLGEIKEKWPQIKVMVLTMHRNANFLQAAIAKEAEGYCLKDTAFPELVRGLRSLIKGEKYLCEEMRSMRANPAAEVFSGPRPSVGNGASLTHREKEILQFVAAGYTNRQIAKTLLISEKTVENHCTNLRTKLGVHSKQELTVHAFRMGLVE
jgi:DNA-binding NarL/FixJ family response regulator